MCLAEIPLEYAYHKNILCSTHFTASYDWPAYFMLADVSKSVTRDFHDKSTTVV